MIAQLLVHDPGPLATVQDLGRIGWQRFGVPQAGAMDRAAFLAANALVGNAPGAAAIEVTLSGGVVELDGAAARVAVTGGSFALAVDGRPVPPWRSFVLQGGARLAIGPAADAIRGYLAIAGGIAVEPVLGSRATHVRSGIGGLEGRALRAGDRLPLGPAPAPCGDQEIDPAALRGGGDGALRVVLGPQDDYFARDQIDRFLAATYAVTGEADRMGYRLSGPTIAHSRGFNIISDGIPAGAVQIPGNGQPIVLLADRQPTGGYPKIATVVTPDLGHLAQRRPGETVRFRAVSLQEAGRIRRGWDARLADLAALLRPAEAGGTWDSARLLRLNLVGGVVAGHEE